MQLVVESGEKHNSSLRKSILKVGGAVDGYYGHIIQETLLFLPVSNFKFIFPFATSTQNILGPAPLSSFLSV